jgi:hypothetical protein
VNHAATACDANEKLLGGLMPVIVALADQLAVANARLAEMEMERQCVANGEQMKVEAHEYP